MMFLHTLSPTPNAEVGTRNIRGPSVPRSEFRVPRSRHQDRHDLMRPRDEPDPLPASLEYERQGLALVRAHAVRALDAVTEPPGPRHLPAGRVVAPQHDREIGR